MELTVLLSPDLAVALAEARSTPARDALDATIGRWRDRIRPVSPGARDPQMSRYFVVDVPDPAEAAALRERLSKLPGVEAAYIKPADSLP
jgi:hypothetical protein